MYHFHLSTSGKIGAQKLQGRRKNKTERGSFKHVENIGGRQKTGCNLASSRKLAERLNKVYKSGPNALKVTQLTVNIAFIQYSQNLER